jgi:hypothetical protein
METGMSRASADEIIDRILTEPAQLTSYEAGGLRNPAARSSMRQSILCSKATLTNC